MTIFWKDLELSLGRGSITARNLAGWSSLEIRWEKSTCVRALRFVSRLLYVSWVGWPQLHARRTRARAQVRRPKQNANWRGARALRWTIRVHARRDAKSM